MSDWPVGISTGCFYYMNLLDCLDPICEGGFCMVEICSSKTHLDYHDEQAVARADEALRARGMEPYSFHAPFHEDIDITSPDGGRRDYALREVMSAARAAVALGARYFVFHPGPEKSFQPSPEERIRRMHNAADILTRVCQYCRQAGVGLVLENMLPHLLFGNMRDMLWVIGAIDSPHVGTCLDTGHAFLSGDIYRVMYKLSGHLQCLHVNDNHGHGDDHLPPPRGSIDWPTLLHKLNEVDFQGGLILELAAQQDRAPEAVMADARQARRYLRDISRHLSLSTPPTVAGATTEPSAH